MKNHSSNFAPLVAVALVVVTAVVVMQVVGRIRPIGATLTAEEGSVKLYAMETLGDEQDFYHNGEDYFVFDGGMRLATIRAGYDQQVSIARVAESDIALVIDENPGPLSGGTTLLVDRDNGAVMTTGDHGSFWGATNDEDYLIYADGSSGETKMVLKSFGEASDKEFSLKHGYGVEQVELSPDGTFMVVAAVWYPTATMNYGKLLSVNLTTGVVTELSTISAKMVDGPDLPFGDVIVGFSDNTHVNFALESTTATYELK